MKNFFLSKINISALILVLVGLQDAIGSMDMSKMTSQDWITTVLGILIMVFRTWYTSTQISGVGNDK
jgi:hypothetical protein